MKQSVRRLLLVCALVFAFAAPAMSHAATAPITQTPNTTGMVYEAGSWLSVSWTSEGIPENADVALKLAEPYPGGLQSQTAVSGLSASGGTEVQIPSTGGPYFYYVEAVWTDDLGEQSAKSDAYWDGVLGSPWWFTIGTLPTVLTQPEAQTATVGDIATFTMSAEGVPTPDIQWQVDHGGGWAEISGATSETYDTPEATADMDGWRYRAVVSNVLGSTYTNEVDLTVVGPSITQTPNTAGMFLRAESELAISWTSKGVPESASVQLQMVKWDLGTPMILTVKSALPVSGTTTATLPAQDGDYYYFVRAQWPDGDGSIVVYSNAYWETEAGSPWTFTVGHGPTVWDQPGNQSAVLGQSATFSATGQAYPTPDVHWEVDDGTGWADIEGANSWSYTTPATTASMDGWRYRAVLSNAIDTTASDAAALTVVLTPTITQQPQAQTVALGASASFEADAVGDPAPDVQWQVNDGSGWSDIPGATSASYTTPATTGTMHGWQYRAVFSNSRGSAASNAAALTVSQSVSISAPLANPSSPKSKRQAAYSATVSPAAAASGASFTLHLLHWETRRVDGVRTDGWYEYPSVTLSVTNATTGALGGTATLSKRGDWKMYVTSTAATPWEAGQSAETLFTVK